RTVIANVALTVAIVTPLWWWRVPYAHAGIAAATAIAGVLNAWLLWRALRREGVYVAQPGWGRWMLRILAALAVMTLAVLAVRHQVGAWAALD
ncbi:hypothetical protein ABTK80_20100, partial [Acinetobacter baumannii]